MNLHKTEEFGRLSVVAYNASALENVYKNKDN